MQSILATATATLRSFGLTRVSMVAMIAMNILNVMGNALVLKTSMPLGVTGVTGVACSSAFAQTIIAMVLLGYLLAKVGIRCHLRMFFNTDRALVRNIYRIGLPSTGENICYQASQLIITYIITFMGTQALTVRVITFNLMWMIMITSMSLSQGTQIIVGHRVGAHDFDKAYELCFKSLKAGLCISFFMALFIYSMSTPILGIFSKDPFVIETSRMLLLIAIFIEPGRVFNMVIISSLKATGDVQFPAIMGILSMFIIAVGLSYLLGIHFKLGLIGVWISFAADEWFRAIFMTQRWRSRIWQTKVLIKAPPQLAYESL
jgi:putative MATE family efflux protein